MRQIPWKPNHGSEQPCRMIVYDTETWQNECHADQNQVIHSLRLGVASFWKRTGLTWTKAFTYRFTDAKQFWESAYAYTSPREPLWIFAHNASFDAAIVHLWGELESGRLKPVAPGRHYKDPRSGEWKQAKNWIGRMAVDNLPFIVEAKHGLATMRFVDTMNYIPLGLGKLAKWVGMVKEPLPTESADDEDWFKRCESDVLITEAVVMKLFGLWAGPKLGTWQPTVAGLAYSCFRHICPDSGIVAHGHERATPEELAYWWVAGKETPLDAYDVSRIERKAYYGARTWCGYVGDIGPEVTQFANSYRHGGSMFRPYLQGPVTVFDANSLYGYVMLTEEYPIEYMDALIDPEAKVAKDVIMNHPCIATVGLYAPNHEYPTKEDGRTVFARGSFTTTLAGPELRIAASRGEIVRYNVILVYHAGKPFTKYVNYWWPIRKEALLWEDDATAKLAKGMITSLYGKLAQRKPTWRIVTDVTPPRSFGPFLNDKGDGKGICRYRSVGNTVQQVQDREDCPHCFTPAAAFITSHARVLMDSIRTALPEKSVVYQDTDSLFCLPSAASAMRESGLVDPIELGRFKEEGTYDHVKIYGPKNYDKNSVPTVAGLRSQNKSGGARSWWQDEFERCSSIIGRTPDGTVHSWQNLFSAMGTSPGFTVGIDGWTEPIRLVR